MPRAAVRTHSHLSHTGVPRSPLRPERGTAAFVTLIPAQGGAVQSTSDPRVPPPEESLILASDLGRIITAGAVLRRQSRSGQLVRIRRGVYMAATEWEKRDRDARYRALVRGTSLESITAPVVSHHSAAALWGLPVLGPWPDEVHLLVERASGGRSDPGIRRHALGLDAAQITTLHGIPVTSLARTVIDVAATSTLHSAVATVDAALHIPRYGFSRLARAELLEVYEGMLPFRGSRRALEVIDFAEVGAGSPRESASRVTIALTGFPKPELQRRFLVDGDDVFGDFYWEEVDGIGECDGLGKYLDPALLKGRTTADVVLSEKRREDSLREQVSKFVRWEAKDALSGAVLTRKLMSIGLRPSRARGSLPAPPRGS